MTDLSLTEIDYPEIGVIESFCTKEQLLTVTQVAIKLSVSKQTIYRMLRDGVFPHSTKGSGRGRIVIPKAEVDSYITKLTTDARRRTV